MQKDKVEFVTYNAESSWEEHKWAVHYSTEKGWKIPHTKMKNSRIKVPNLFLCAHLKATILRERERERGQIKWSRIFPFWAILLKFVYKF